MRELSVKQTGGETPDSQIKLLAYTTSLSFLSLRQKSKIFATSLIRGRRWNASTFDLRVFFSCYMLELEYPRLPLMRELSAKLTEGETLNGQINIFAYATKITVNIQIANSHYR